MARTRTPKQDWQWGLIYYHRGQATNIKYFLRYEVAEREAKTLSKYDTILIPCNRQRLTLKYQTDWVNL